jgi:hypothetical protein
MSFYAKNALKIKSNRSLFQTSVFERKLLEGFFLYRMYTGMYKIDKKIVTSNKTKIGTS